MSYLMIWNFLFFVLLSSSQQTRQAEYTVSVQGRAVDAFGHPVKDARIVVSPLPEPVVGDIVYLTKADNDGSFRYSQTERGPKHERLLYVVGPFHEGSVSLISPPFYELPKIPTEQYAGRRILIRPNEVVDVGDVPIQIRYETVNVHILDQSGTPILVHADQWEYVWLRIRNLRRDIICESGLSRDDIHNKVHLSESMIPLDIPEGTWRLEVSIKGHGGLSHASTTLLTVTSTGSPIEVTLRMADENR
jgi:hypothetical protein